MSTISDWSREKLIEEIDLLNKKNAALKKTSSNLSNTNKLLESSDQQLKAANQQLAASEHQVRQNEEIFKALLDGIEDVIYVSDPETYDLVHVNTIARETWGEDIIGMKCYKALQNRDEPCPFCTNNIIFKDNQKSAYVWEFQNEVNKHWYRCSDRAITWPDGRKLRFEIAADVTPQKEKEEMLTALNQQLSANEQQLQAANQQLNAANQQLQASELQIRQNFMQFKSLFDGIDDVIYVSDPDTYEIVHVNDTAKKFWGEDIIGQKCYKVLQNRETPCPFCTNNIIFNEKPGETYFWEFQNEVNHHWFRCADKVIEWPDGRKLRFELASDITELKSNEEKLEKLNINLASKTEELQQILYITTHDLRSPLVNVQGFSKELLSSINELNKIMAHEEIPDEVKNRAALILNEELPESIHYITTSIAKMDNLLMGLLQISRLGRQESRIDLLSMNILMQQVVDSYKYEIHKGLIEVVIKDLPRCYGDKDQINQLFSNLLGNAIKFLSPERKGKIVISGTEEKKFARYKIKDNGIGIEKAHQKKIFEMFYKLDPNKPGSGLGMSIIKQIVEKNNGSIQLVSEYGEGTEITINLPVHFKK